MERSHTNRPVPIRLLPIGTTRGGGVLLGKGGAEIGGHFTVGCRVGEHPLVEFVGLVFVAQLVGHSHPHILTMFHRQPLAEARSEEHTSELQSLMRLPYAVFCLKKKMDKKMTTDV